MPPAIWRALAASLLLGACSGPTPTLEQQTSPLRPPTDTIGDLFLGQQAPTDRDPNAVDPRGFDQPEGIAIDAHSSPPAIFVADTSNSRVLAWRSAEGFANGAPADAVIGQPDFHTTACVQPLQGAGLCHPTSVAVDGTGRLFVADRDDNRVLVFDAPWALDGGATVIGQATLQQGTCNGAGLSSSSLCRPSGVAVDSSGNLFVADTGNHRVMVFNPIATGAAAAFELGQLDFGHGEPNILDGIGYHHPSRIVFDKNSGNTRVYVSDAANHRVLCWRDEGTYVTGAPADSLIGQPDLSTEGCNTGGRSAHSLCGPEGLAVDSQHRLLVADTLNNRVLFFTNCFTTPSATAVWGQGGDFTTDAGCVITSNTSLCGPEGVAIDPQGAVIVADTGNHRVLTFLDAGVVTADQVIGQINFAANAANQGGSATAASFARPRGVTVGSTGTLWVADTDNGRVLGFDGGSTSAEVVLGQQNFTTVGCNQSDAFHLPDPTTLCRPSSVALDATGQLWVGDEGSGRVVGYAAPFSSGASAVKVAGRPGLGTFLDCPTSGICFGTDLGDQFGPAAGTDLKGAVFAVDTWDNRVLEYSAPFGDGGSVLLPNAVFGETDLFSVAPNFPEPDSLSGPLGVHFDPVSNRLYVADTDNSRVLWWELSTPLSNGRSADGVLGQPATTAAACNYDGGPSASTLCNAVEVTTDSSGRVYVADGWQFLAPTNNRVLVYDPPSASGAPATQVLGQPDFATTGCSATEANTLCGPRGVSVDPSNGALFVSDQLTHRVVRFDSPLTNADAGSVLGQTTLDHDQPNFVDLGALDAPSGAAIDNASTPRHLFVADTQNSRVLGWSDVTLFTNGLPADLVLGQPDPFSAQCDDGGTAGSFFCYPTAIAVSSTGELVIADTGKNRVLIYAPPFESDAGLLGMIGQPDLTGSACNQGSTLTGSTLCAPAGVAVDPGGLLFVSDQGNHRVLTYSQPLDGGAANGLYGQTGFKSTAGCNHGGGPNANNICAPAGLAIDSTQSPHQLWIADSLNNRVLGLPVTLAVGSIQVIGQTDVNSRNAGAGQLGLTHPLAVAVDADGGLYVADTGNSRVLAYGRPTGSDPAAIHYFGQDDSSVSSGCNVFNFGSATDDSLCGPQGLTLDDIGNLYVADNQNHRVVVYQSDHRPTASDVTLSPSAPTIADTLTASYTFHDDDPGDLEVGTEIHWYLNTIEQPAYFDQTQIPSSALVRGQTWWFTVRPGDGLELGLPVQSSSATVVDAAPVATASGPATVAVGQSVTLTGAATDLENDPITFLWTPTAYPTGAPPALDDPTRASATFTATAAGPYTFQLVANDGQRSSAPVTLTVISQSKGGCQTTGTSLAGGYVLLVALGWAIRRRRFGAGAIGLVVAACVVGPRAMAEPIAAPPNPYLDKARAQVQGFELDGAMTQLELALAVKGVTPAQKIEIYKLMALTHSAFDERAPAVDAFFKLLELDPGFELEGEASPKVRDAFEAAEHRWRLTQVVKLEHHSPKRAELGQNTPIDVSVLSGGERVATMTLHFRERGPGAYSQIRMTRGQGGSFSAWVPEGLLGSSGTHEVDYFVRARSADGALLASVGDEDHPLRVSVAVAEKRSSPIYKSPWLWGGLAVAAIAATAVVLLVPNDAHAPAGTLGKENLP